jgi:hypothetical protein
MKQKSSGQHTLACQKMYKKKEFTQFCGTRICIQFFQGSEPHFFKR